MNNTLKLPQFLGIGAQKSGTTWLHTMLKDHPEIYLPQKKEVHFFDQNYTNGLDWYANHYMFAGDKLRGELTPAYALLDVDVFRFIKELNPRMKAVFLLRSPTDRAWSHALMEYLVVQKRDFSTLTDEDFIRHFDDEGSYLRGYYAKTIKNWYSVFPKESLYIGLYDDIKNNPERLLREIFTFLGLNDEKFIYDAKINSRVFPGSGHSILPKHREHLAKKYKNSIIELLEIVDRPEIEKW